MSVLSEALADSYRNAAIGIIRHRRVCDPKFKATSET